MAARRPTPGAYRCLARNSTSAAVLRISRRRRRGADPRRQGRRASPSQPRPRPQRPPHPRPHPRRHRRRCQQDEGSEMSRTCQHISESVHLRRRRNRGNGLFYRCRRPGRPSELLTAVRRGVTVVIERRQAWPRGQHAAASVPWMSGNLSCFFLRRTPPACSSCRRAYAWGVAECSDANDAVGRACRPCA